MKILNVLIAFAIALATIHAADSAVTGKWTTEFDTQVGPQKYHFEFKKSDDGKLTAKADAWMGEAKRSVEFKDVKLAGEELTFVEMFKFEDNEVKITYTGKVKEGEIKFKRQVADFATEEFVAKRAEPKAESK